MEPSTLFQAFPQLDTGTHDGCIVQLQVTPDGRSLVSAGETTIRVWDITDVSQRRLKRLLLGRVNGPTDDGAIDGRAARFAISRDGRWLVALKPWRHASLRSANDPAAGHGHDAGRVTEVQVFELATGNLQSRFVHPGQLLDLDFSPDGRWLAGVANVRVGSKRQVEVRVWATRELLRPGARDAPPAHARLAVGKPRRASTLPAALRFVPPAYAAAGGAATLVVAAGDATAATGQLAWLRFEPASGLAQDRLAGTREAIAVDTLAVSATMVVIGAAPPAGRKLRGRYFWFRDDDQGGDPEQGAIDTEAPVASAAFAPSGDRLAVGLMVEPGAGGQDAPSGTQIVQVNVYDAPAVYGPLLRSTYFGHDGTVQALAFCDETTVASAGGDNHAIHFWTPAHRIAEGLGAIRGVGRMAIEPGITADERVLFGTVPERLLPPGHAMRQQSFSLRRMALSTTATSDLRRRDFASRKWWVGDGEQMVIPLWFIGDDDGTRGDPTRWMPDLTLFVGADDAWVIWSRSGYYDAGGGDDAARRIGYRVNRGIHQEGLLIPCDRFKAFYRPDIVRAVVRHGTEERARARGADIPAVDVACILPPIAELAREGIRKLDAAAAFTFTVEAPCPEHLPTRASLLRNGRVVWAERDLPPRRRARHVVPALPLLPGVNRFAFHVENTQAKSVPVEFELDGPVPAVSDGSDAPQAHTRGHLFLLAVGVAEFADPGSVKLRFPQRDAQAVFDAFGHGRIQQRPSGPPGRRRTGNQAFKSVDAKLLVNKQATKAAILGELQRMCDRIRARHRRAGAERDVLFVFLSGHGLRAFDKQGVPNLFFQNYDMVPTREDVVATGLSMLDLGDRITSVPAEVVLVIDACHAALAGRSTVAGLDAEELARRVHSIYERGMYLVGASRFEELSHEDGSSRFGVLTSAMLKALDQVRRRPRGARPTGHKAQLDVLMAELVAGVQRLVPKVSARAGTDAQTPVCRIYGDLLPLTILKT